MFVSIIKKQEAFFYYTHTDTNYLINELNDSSKVIIRL
jgi:hypothetical protein